MKKSFILLFIPLFFIACAKEEVEEEVVVQEVDFRDEFTGDYSYEITKTIPEYTYVDSLGFSVFLYETTTYNYDGYVAKSLETDSGLIVHWGMDTITITNGTVHTMTNEVLVSPEGTLTFSEGLNYYSFPALEVGNDSIEFNFNIGGLAASSTWIVSGVILE